MLCKKGLEGIPLVMASFPLMFNAPQVFYFLHFHFTSASNIRKINTAQSLTMFMIH